MKLSFDPRLLTEVIGKGQYTQFRSIIAEYVANSWDAEAKRIDVVIPNDFTLEPIIIKDNGKGIADLTDFEKVGANIQIKKNVSSEFLRKIMGRKGIGRFAGFACASKITYESYTGTEKHTIIFDRSELLKHTSIEEIDIPSKSSNSNELPGTIVTLENIDDTYSIPSVNQIIRDILLDFGYVSDFQIFVNDELCQPSQILGEIFEIDEVSKYFGHISGNIIVAKSKSKKMFPGIIIRVKNRRVEGPSFFGIEDDYSTKIMNRIYGDINADGLEDIISSGREAFIQHDERYKALIDWIKEKIIQAVAKIESEVSVDTEDIIFNLPRFQKKLNQLPIHLQTTAKNYIKKISPKLGRVKNDKELLETFALLILRASENADFYAVLDELEKTENMDISTLAKVLEHWGFGEIAYASSLIQNRIRILEKFAVLVNDKKTLELQGIHRVLATSTWILDDRYSLFTSNESLRTVLKKLQSKYEGKSGRKRPDLILKRDRDDFVLIELKAPDVIITLEEVSQVLVYQNEIEKNYPNARDFNLYLVGKQYDEITTKKFPVGNQQKIHLLSLNEILANAEDRLKWLSKSLKDEYDLLSYDYEAVELLSDVIVK